MHSDRERGDANHDDSHRKGDIPSLCHRPSRTNSPASPGSSSGPCIPSRETQARAARAVPQQGTYAANRLELKTRSSRRLPPTRSYSKPRKIKQAPASHFDSLKTFREETALHRHQKGRCVEMWPGFVWGRGRHSRRIRSLPPPRKS